ncbi:protein PIF-like isoform X6 [Gigantopelta aegis]|uniref:protein PIF-like isoform X6 n=2 Tax=Gigantopelta aegis TaxID=1735272 RepID=UPI001B889041|nr:protein PIF-like isoform X6 [Gigantopelta aegis]
MQGSCRGYWTCVNGKSEAACCPVGFAYVETKGCLVDFTCRDMCPTICTGKEVCNVRPWWNDTHKYEEGGGDNGWRASTCKKSSLYFDIVGCQCSKAATKVCDAVMTMDFSNPNRLTTAPGVKVTTSNVTFINGMAMFSGHGLIRTSMSLVEAAGGCPVTIRLSYKSTTSDRQVLVKSPLCRMAESSSLVVTVDGNDVVLEMKNWFGTAMSMRVPTDDFKTDEWKQVSFVYDGKFATGRVSGDKVTYIFKTFAPKISIAQCGLDFGTDEKKGAFTGEMDTIGVYQCNPWTPVY